MLIYFILPPLGNNAEERGDCEIINESRDNRAIIDNNKAQSLTGEDIDAMRRWGFHNRMSGVFLASELHVVEAFFYS